jgi:hypothetical protein
LVPLEKLFDHNDVAIKLEKKEEESDVSQFNVASEQNPKFVNLASHLTDKQKADYGELLKEFVDIFAWKYEDLKTYNTEIIQHKIPLNKDTKPFRQKLRSFSPMLLPIMEKEIKKMCWMPRSSSLLDTLTGLPTLFLLERKMVRLDFV